MDRYFPYIGRCTDFSKDEKLHIINEHIHQNERWVYNPINVYNNDGSTIDYVLMSIKNKFDLSMYLNANCNQLEYIPHSTLHTIHFYKLKYYCKARAYTKRVVCMLCINIMEYTFPELLSICDEELGNRYKKKMRYKKLLKTKRGCEGFEHINDVYDLLVFAIIYDTPKTVKCIIHQNREFLKYREIFKIIALLNDSLSVLEVLE